MATAKKSEIGCLRIGALFLIAIGICIFFYPNGRDHQHPAQRGLPIWTIIVFSSGLIVPGVGLLVMAVPVRRWQLRTAELRATNPDRPWMWKTDWASGQIPDQGGSEAALLWIVALMFICLTAPCAVACLQDWTERRQAKGLIGLLFLAVDVFITGWAVHSTIRSLRFGKSVFEIHTLPAMVGGTLSGMIRIDRPVDFPQGVVLRLACFRFTSRQTVVWDSEQAIDQIFTASLAREIPVVFRIPADAPPCDDSNPNDRIQWRLECRAASESIRYVVGFNVPVFPAVPSQHPSNPPKRLRCPSMPRRR